MNVFRIQHKVINQNNEVRLKTHSKVREVTVKFFNINTATYKELYILVERINWGPTFLSNNVNMKG